LQEIKEWTDQLIVPIQAMSEHSIDLPLPITLGKYNAITHLTYIPTFTDLIEPYIIVMTEETPPTLLQHLFTPSHISISSDKDETDHPGEDWMLYNATNPKHYMFIFINKQNNEEVAKYICYHSIQDGVHLQGQRSKNTPLYTIPLHGHAFSNANFFRSGLRDTDLGIFHPSAISHLVVDDALFHLGDPGVIADIHCLQAQYTHLKNIKRQRLELDILKCKAEKEKMASKQYLAYATIHTQLHPYLICRQPASPPSYVIPYIHAAQRPSNDMPINCEGEDSLEHQKVKKPCLPLTHPLPPTPVLGKCKLPPYPYCLKYHSEDPGHDSE
jgi:hypothetical protein